MLCTVCIRHICVRIFLSRFCFFSFVVAITIVLGVYTLLFVRVCVYACCLFIFAHFLSYYMLRVVDQCELTCICMAIFLFICRLKWTLLDVDAVFFSLTCTHYQRTNTTNTHTSIIMPFLSIYLSLSLPTCTINQMRWCDKTLILLQIKRTLASTKSIPIPIQFSSPLVLHTMITNLTNRCIDFASSDFSVCVRVCVCVRLNESVRMFAFLCYVNLTPHIIFIYFFLLLLFLWRCGKYENMKPEKSMC